MKPSFLTRCARMTDCTYMKVEPRWHNGSFAGWEVRTTRNPSGADGYIKFASDKAARGFLAFLTLQAKGGAR